MLETCPDNPAAAVEPQKKFIEFMSLDTVVAPAAEVTSLAEKTVLASCLRVAQACGEEVTAEHLSHCRAFEPLLSNCTSV